MGKRGYPPEFRRRVLDLVEAGRKVAEVAEDLGISDRNDLQLASPGPSRSRARAGSHHGGAGRVGGGPQQRVGRPRSVRL